MANSSQAKRRHDPGFVRNFHYVCAVLFAVQIPWALATDIKKSLPYVVFLSQWALVAAHWGAAHAAKRPGK